MTWRLTYAGSKLAGLHAYFPEWAGVGFSMVTVDIALPSDTSLLVIIEMPPLDKATSSVSSTGCGFVTGFGGENVVLRPPLGLFNFGSGVGETKSPENSFNLRKVTLWSYLFEILYE